jgi:hypothetical protein
MVEQTTRSSETPASVQTMLEARPTILALVYGYGHIDMDTLVAKARMFGINEDVVRGAVYSLPEETIEFGPEMQFRMRRRPDPMSFAHMFHDLAGRTSSRR